jgi:folate-binding protein YgfZ
VNLLSLHEFHQGLHARFAEQAGMEVVAHYADSPGEYAALCESAGVLDLSFRGRLCLTGTQRQEFLHGQVTNNVKALKVGKGCYAALVTAKGRMQSDLNIACLSDELLLDFEPGLSQTVAQRLEKYVIVEDVQVVDAAPHYGLLSVQGPKAVEVVTAVGLVGGGSALPASPYDFVTVTDEMLGQIYVMNLPRLGSLGFDLYVPTPALAAVADKLIGSAKGLGGRACGWDAFEIARVEAGIPRFGADMDEHTIPAEAGLDARAVSYSKGCYIGQEVIARIRTYGQVAKALRGLNLGSGLKALPHRGDKLFKDGQEVGFITSAVVSPRLKTAIALGYVRKETNQIGAELSLGLADGGTPARVVELPFGVDSCVTTARSHGICPA